MEQHSQPHSEELSEEELQCVAGGKASIGAKASSVKRSARRAVNTVVRKVKAGARKMKNWGK
jgi:bacteriocin-like protein